MIPKIINTLLIPKQIHNHATELRARYDRQAAGWQATIERLRQPEAYDRLVQKLAAMGIFKQWQGETAVLDCGIGTGALTAAVIRHNPAPSRYEGIDISNGMLREARRCLPQRDVDLYLWEENATALRYSDATFDMVMSAHMVEHLPNPQAGLLEMVRVLKPNAPLLIVMTRWGLPGWIIGRRWGVQPIRPRQLEGWFEQVGLRQVQLLPLSRPTQAAYWLSVACVGFKNLSGQSYSGLKIQPYSVKNPDCQ